MRPILKIHCIVLTALLSVLCYSYTTLAMPAQNSLVPVTQPDGTPIQIRFFGDEWYGWAQTEDGYTVIQDKEGWWRYAQLDDKEKFVPSDIAVSPTGFRKSPELEFIEGMGKHLRESENEREERMDWIYSKSFPFNPNLSRRQEKGTTTNNLLLILVDYPDFPATETVQSFHDLMNQDNYNGTGSFNQYYREISYNRFGVTATIVGWYTAPKPHGYYAWERDSLTRSLHRVHELVAWAVDQAIAGGVDFSQFDNDTNGVVDGLFVVHAGSGAEEGKNDQIWSHRHYLEWSGNERIHKKVTIDEYVIVPEKFRDDHARIGVYCHEYGHILGLPDLYDPDGSSYGIGTWGLMGLGGWGGNCQNPEKPSHMCAWSKTELDWADPIVVRSDLSNQSLNNVELNDEIFKLWTNGEPSVEYFLLENRQRIGFDEYLPGEGLLVWHIDETVVDRRGRSTNRNENHKAVDLEAADGRNHMDNSLLRNKGDSTDPFRGSDTFDSRSNPNSRDNRGNYTYVGVTTSGSGPDPLTADLNVIRPPGTPDLVIRDCSGDVGSEPDDQCLDDFARSPDIWIDNDSDGAPDPFAPGVVNRVWARVWNIGNKPATDVRVSFWRANPTLGLRIPDDMTIIYDEITGDSVRTVALVPATPVPGVGSGTVVSIDALLPDPPYCLGVIVESDEDPPTSTSPLEENNLAQLNMWSIRQNSTPGQATVFTSIITAGNPTNEKDFFNIVTTESLPDGWEARVEPETFSLDPGETTPLILTVEAPAGAAHGDTGLVFVDLFRSGAPTTSLGTVVIDVGIDNAMPAAITDLTALRLCPEGEDFPRNLVTVRLTWTGVKNDTAGDAEEIKLYYVHRDTTEVFTPDSTNLVDSTAVDADTLLPDFQWDDEIDLTPPGLAKVISSPTNTTEYYYKVISADRAGNRSDPSNEATPVWIPCDTLLAPCFQGPPELHVLKSEGCEPCGLDADNIVIKPDTDHEVCVYIDSICSKYDIETIHFMLTWNGDIQFKIPESITFDCTDLDSSGWDIKYHQDNDPGAGRDSIEVWLISGGNAQRPLGEAGCILRIGFHTQASAQPGDRDTIHFEFAEWNEGGEMVTNDFYKKINEPPVITWFGVDAPDTIDAIVLQESHSSTYLIDAHDYDIDCNHPCGDSIILWAQSDPLIDPCPWVEGATFDTVDQTDGLEQVLDCGYVEGEFVFHPPKLGICDDFWVDFIAVSTWETGQPLYDTLTVHFFVQDCELLVAWPETTWHAGGWIEIPLRIHPDYDCLADLDVTAAYFELNYDPSLMTVGEVGNKGLITEEWGALTYRLDEENGKIYAVMAGNYPLPQCDPLCTWYDMLYVGFDIHPDAAQGDRAVLSIENVKFNEGEPRACWIDTSYFEVVRYSISGTVELCSTGVAVDSVLMTLTWDIDLDSLIDFVWLDTTDVNGDYLFDSLYGSTGEYCLIPSKEGGLGKQTITSLDASLILRSLTGLGLDACQLEAADVTGDGTVSAFDASVVLKYVVCGNCQAPLVPGHIIGTWLFFPPQRCYQSINEDYTDEDFYAVLGGDVTKNWPGPPSPKGVAGGIDVAVRANMVTLTFAEPANGLDLTVSYRADLQPVGVSIDGAMVEWRDDGHGVRVAAASEAEFSEVTFEFSELLPTTMEISALVNEGTILITSAKIAPIPTEFALEPNYPNPFNPYTEIRYQIAGSRYPVQTSLKIYNILGQEVRTLVDEVKEPGYYRVTWDGTDSDGGQAASGVYFYHLVAGEYITTRCMVLMK